MSSKVEGIPFPLTALNYALYTEKLGELCASLGFAVARWANLEGQLLLLAGDALGLDDPKDMASIMAPLRSFSALLEFVDACVKIKLTSHGQVRHWNSLHEFIRELSGDRNFLAHQGIVAHNAGDANDPGFDWSKATPKVGPSMSAAIQGPESWKIAPMDIEEVEELAEDFQLAILFVMDLRQELLRHGPLPERFFEPVSRRRPSRGERRAQSRRAP